MQDDALSFSLTVDTSQLDAGLAELDGTMERLFSAIVSGSEEAAAEAGAALERMATDVPELRITADSSTLDGVRRGLDQVAEYGEKCASTVTALRRLYDQYGAAAKAAAAKGTAGGQQEAAACEVAREGLARLIESRAASAQAVEAEATRLASLGEQYEANQERGASLRDTIRELQEVAAGLTMRIAEEGDANGALTAQLQTTLEKLGEYRDIQGDIRSAGNVFARDEQQAAALGASLGVATGTMQTAAGAMALFGTESEAAQQVMLKLNAIQSVCNGLTSLQTALNKDGIIVQTAKAFAHKAKTAALLADSAATAANTAATTANTAAQGGNAAATATNTATQGAATVATAALGTASVSTGAMVKGLGVALKGLVTGIPVIGWVVAGITAAVAVCVKLWDMFHEVTESQKAATAAALKGKQTSEEASAALSGYTDRLEACSAGSEKEALVVAELNGKYGEQLGKWQSAAEWRRVLSEKGAKYVEILEKEAEATSLANSITERRNKLLEQQSAKDISDKDAKLEDEAIAKQLTELSALRKEIDALRSKGGIGTSAAKGTADAGPLPEPKETWDWSAAARERKAALEKWTAALRGYVAESERSLAEARVEAMSEGLEKELARIDLQTKAKKAALTEQIDKLASELAAAEKSRYMSRKGATEDGWDKTAAGKRTAEDWRNTLLSTEPEVQAAYLEMLGAVDDAGRSSREAATRRNTEKLVSDYGDRYQQLEQLARQWEEKLAGIPAEYMPAAVERMKADLSAAASEGAKADVGWDEIMAQSGTEATGALVVKLQALRDAFGSVKDKLGDKELREWGDAISKLEAEVSSRNPFTAMASGIEGLKAAKDEVAAATAEWTLAQRETTVAQEEYNAALQAEADIRAQIAEGTLSADSETAAAGKERLAKASTSLAASIKKEGDATAKVNNATAKLNRSQKQIATGASAVKQFTRQVTGFGREVGDLFGGKVGRKVKAATDVVDSLMDCVEDTIDGLSQLAESTASGIEGVVEGTAGAMKGTSAAAAQAMSTMEKASVILVIIQAAMQVAMAMVNLFKDDTAERIDAQIEELGKKRERLEWELENQEAMNLRKNTGVDAVKELQAAYKSARAEVLNLSEAQERRLSGQSKTMMASKHSLELEDKMVEKLTASYSALAYGATKSSGFQERQEQQKAELENLARQNAVIAEQIALEKAKPNTRKKDDDTDWDKVEEFQQQMEENWAKIAQMQEEMVEGFVGMDFSGLADNLSSAFFDACANGEDAMQAWADSADDIVREMTRKMLTQQFLEKPMQAAMDKFRQNSLGEDGIMFDQKKMASAAVEFNKDLKASSSQMQMAMDSLPAELREIVMGKAEETVEDIEAEETVEDIEPEKRGIATASQESVDENNARLTAIQGAVYTMQADTRAVVSNTAQLLQVAISIQRGVGEIGEDTARLKEMGTLLRSLESGVSAIGRKV